MAYNGAGAVLDGVRVLELARWQAAPRGGLILQDMGAEVIKLEWRKGADLRDSGPFVGKMSVQFAAYNRGKKSVTLNTRHDKARTCSSGSWRFPMWCWKTSGRARWSKWGSATTSYAR